MTGIQVAITETPYEVAGHDARLFALEGGGRVQVEVYDGYFSAAWSSMRLGEVLARLSPLLPQAAGAGILLPRSGEFVECSLDGALSAIRSRPDDFEFIRLEYPDRTFTWQSATDSPEADQSPQFGFIGETFERQYAADLLRTTGMNEISEAVDEILAKAAPLVTQFRPRTPLSG